jgi:hypothetical protein
MSRRVPPLDFIEPQLPTPTEQPPEGSEWIHEVKHDGYRTLLMVERRQARAFTRNGYDWSARYPAILAGAAKLPCPPLSLMARSSFRMIEVYRISRLSQTSRRILKPSTGMMQRSQAISVAEHRER